MKEKPCQHAAHNAPGVSTISLHPRQSGGSTESSSRRPAFAQTWLNRAGLIRVGNIGPMGPSKCADRMAAPLPATALWPYIRAVTAPDPLLVFDRAVLRRR